MNNQNLNNQNMNNQNMYYQQYQTMAQQHPQQVMQQYQHQQQQTVHLGKRPIAPAPAPTALAEHNQLNRVSSTITNSKKAKMTYAQMAYTATQPPSVQRRNARERNRVKQVNNGFNNLRQHIPSEVVTQLASSGRGASKKLSKVDTLKMAVKYIRSLQGLLDDSDDSMSATSSSASSSTSSNSYYSPSPVQCSTTQQPMYSGSSASPTPSYTSDNSSIENSSYIVPTTHKYEAYDNYNHEDEEFLDAISWWQEQ